MVAGGRAKNTWAQWRGIFGHRFLEYAVTRGRDAALTYIRSKKFKDLAKTCARIDVEALPMGRFEVGYAYNANTGEARELSRAGWNLQEGEQYTRIDCEVNDGGELHLIDYKFYSVIEEDPRDPQLLGHALSSLRCYSDPWGITPPGVAKPDSVRISLAGVLADGSIEWRSVRLSETDLDRFETATRQIHQVVLQTRERCDSGEAPKFNRGPACAWCDLKAFCPEWTPTAGGDARPAAPG